MSSPKSDSNNETLANMQTNTSMNTSFQSIDNVLKGPTHSMTPNNRKKLENDRKRLQSQLDKKVKQYEDNC